MLCLTAYFTKRFACLYRLNRTDRALFPGGACRPVKRCGAAFLHGMTLVSPTSCFCLPHPCGHALLCNMGGLTCSEADRMSAPQIVKVYSFVTLINSSFLIQLPFVSFKYGSTAVTASRFIKP